MTDTASSSELKRRQLCPPPFPPEQVWGDPAEELWAELLRLMSSYSGHGPAAPDMAVDEAAPPTTRGWRLPWEAREYKGKSAG